MRVNKNIAIIGMSGTFKSTVAKKLAPFLGKRSLDVDELIEFEYGCTISELFKKSGEEYFRQIEKRIINDAADFSDIVLATGGGAVLNSENMSVLKENFLIVALDADAKRIFSRLKNAEDRPLLTPFTLKKIEEYVAHRRHLYCEWADKTINTNGKTSDTVTNIIKEWYLNLMQKID